MMVTLKRFLRVWVGLSPAVRKSVLKDYGISFFNNDSGESYWIDAGTCSGFQLAPKGKTYIILSGVDYVQYFQDNDLVMTLDSDVEEVFEFLKVKDSSNKDRLSKLIFFVKDIATRDTLGK